MAHIKFKNVTVQYPLYNAHSLSLRNQLVRIGTGGRLAKESSNIVTITALDSVSFELDEGDTVGLVGHNGAGKTTLLRTMAGIYPPVVGEVQRQGKVSTIIELGAGLDVELSGYENIVRMGMLLGSSRREMEAAIPGVEAFTELGDFLSMPVRTYSSGMVMRLMFAVGTAIRPEILLIDEMFGTGDAAFQEKAQNRMHELISAAKIFVFASHSPELIKRYCRRVFSLEHGTLTELNAPVSVAYGGVAQPGPDVPASAAVQSVAARPPNTGERVRKPVGNVVVPNPTYAQDGLYTLHCADFMMEERFAKAYAAGEATGSWSGAAVHWRVYVACWLAERASELEGDLIECGVNRGGIFRAIVSYLGEKLHGRHIYLLDTFQGIPTTILSAREKLHDKYFKENYTECYQDVLNTFREFPQVSIVKGLVPDTFGSVDSERFCFAHIDMNNAISEIAAAEYLWPRLAVGGFMLLDDYAWEINVDQRQAFDRFAGQRDMTVLALPTGQGLLMKTREAGGI
jgi:ABC-type polysaccharide/polyol phosphate transport system ATPase subunit